MKWILRSLLRHFEGERTVIVHFSAGIGVLILVCLGIGLSLMVQFVGSPVVAQSAPDPRWVQFTQKKDRLISNNVQSIFVDGGSLWFGADDGISRFNGVWSTYFGDTDSLYGTGTDRPAAHGQFEAFTRMPSDGAIWAGTDNGTLAHWDGASWSIAAQIHSPIHALSVTAGILWIGTDDGLYMRAGSEISLVDALGRQPIHALLMEKGTIWVGAQNGLWRKRDNTWSHIGAEQPILASGVYALGIDQVGTLLVGTPFGVAWRTESEGGSWQLFQTLDEVGKPALVQSLAIDTSGIVWAGTDGAGAFAYRLDKGEYANFGYTGDPNLTTRFVRDIAVDEDGAIWFATPAGVFRYQKQMWFNDVQGPNVADPRNYINDLLVDRDGVLWIATGGGGVRRKEGVSTSEQVFAEADGVPNTVLVLQQDSQGSIWAGTFTGLFRLRDNTWTSPISAARLPSQTVTSLLSAGDMLWIGTEAGLAAYDVVSGHLSVEPTFRGISIEALAADDQSRLWVGTTKMGIWLRQQDGTWRHFVHDPKDSASLPGDQIGGSGLAADPKIKGGMWAIVVGEGLVHWDGQRWARSDRTNQLPSNLLWTVFSNPDDGSLWIGSEAGVTKYDGLTWGTLGAQDGLQSAVIYAIARAKDGGYWLGGRSGLSYYRPDRTPPWISIGPLTGNIRKNANGDIQVTTGKAVIVNFAAGDLQTPQDRLKILFRQTGPNLETNWDEIPPGAIPVKFAQPGVYTLDFLVRDQSFNYSSIVSQKITAVPPPPLVYVPLLGPVERDVFHTLVILGSVALLGASYVSLEIIQSRRRSIDALNREYNPYVSGEPVRRDDMFFGRRELVQRIVDTLHNNSIMIHGERRIGKTSLLYQLVNVLRDVNDPEFWFVPVYVDLEGTAQETFFSHLMDEIIDGVEALEGAETELSPFFLDLRHATLPSTYYTDRDFNRDLGKVTELLQDYGYRHDPDKQIRLILLMDEMDVMSKYDHLVQQQLRRIFMREFAATLGAVVAGIQISKDWDRVESPWYNLFNEIALEPFTRDQALSLLIEPVRGYYVYETAAVEFILQHSGGRPFKIQQYGLEAVNNMLAQRRRRITLEDVEAAHVRIQQDNVNGLDYLDTDDPEDAPQAKTAREDAVNNRFAYFPENDDAPDASMSANR